MYNGLIAVIVEEMTTCIIEGNEIDGILPSPSVPYYASFATHTAVVAVARSNITLSGEQTIDGHSCVSGDRVLAVGQTTGAARGAYVVSTGAWTRVADFASGSWSTNDGFQVTYGTDINYLTSGFPGAIWYPLATGTIGTNSSTWDMWYTGKKIGIDVSNGGPYPVGTGGPGTGNPTNVNVVIANNVIRNISETVGPSTQTDTTWATDGIQINSSFAKVIGNHIENVTSNGYKNCEGIYAKCRYGVIAFNTLHDAGHMQGAIAIKGQAEGLDFWNVAPHPPDNTATTGDIYGYAILCSGNRIMFSDGSTTPRWGISVWTGPNITVRDNYIYGANIGAYVVTNNETTQAVKGLRIDANTIKHCVECANLASFRSDYATSSNAYVTGIWGMQDNMAIAHNWIEDVKASTVAAYGIFVPASNSYNPAFDNVRIVENTIYDLDGISGSSGMLLQSATYCYFTNIRMAGNWIDTIKAAGSVTYPVKFRQMASWTGEITGNTWANSYSGVVNSSSWDVEPTGCIVRNNKGTNAPVTFAEGTGTLTTGGGGDDAITISPALSWAPAAKDIQITPTSFLAGIDSWAITATATNSFTITGYLAGVQTAPSTAFTFSYKIRHLE